MKSFCILLILWAGPSGPVGAKRHLLTPQSDWFGVLHGDGLRPGDEVILGAGTYSDRRRLEMSHRGTRDKPIVIRGEGAILRRPDARQNSINMTGCQFLELRDLEITGGSAGIRISKKGAHLAKHLLFEGLHIHHLGGVAITANHEDNVYEGLVFRGNHIHHTGGHGEAFYLGCNNRKDGTTPGYIFDSVVEGNHIHDLNGPEVSQGDGIEIKDGSYGNIIRDNVIHDTKYPGILVYGTDGRDRNVIERNVIWNSGDHGIQAAADAIIRNNIIFDTRGAGIRSGRHQSARVGNLLITNNTVITPQGTAIRIEEPADPASFDGQVIVVNNALYGRTALRVGPTDGLIVSGNAGRGQIVGRRLDRWAWDGSGDPERDFMAGTFFPTRTSTLIGRGRALRYRAKDDFNGSDRLGTKVAGAYMFDPQGNPGWAIGKGFKGDESATPLSR